MIIWTALEHLLRLWTVDNPLLNSLARLLRQRLQDEGRERKYAFKISRITKYGAQIQPA